MKFNVWTSSNIATWNKSKFPHNTATKQLRKLVEEIGEWKEARGSEHKLEELADVYIASAGLLRFGAVGVIGSFICFLLQTLDGEGERKGRLQYAVQKKMEINIEREFDIRMHHIG